MTERTSRARMLEIFQGDVASLEELCRVGIVPDDELTPLQVEHVLVAHTLVHGLDVNLSGVEVILRLRAELMETRTRFVSLVQRLKSEQDAFCNRCARSPITHLVFRVLLPALERVVDAQAS